MAEITAEYVLGLYRWGLQQQQERGLRSFIREMRQMYDMKRPVRIPKEYRAIAQEVRSGQTLMRDIAGRVTASLTKEPPVYQVDWRDDTDDTKRAASIGGRWLGQTIKDMARMTREDVIFKSAGSLVLDSESVIKVVHRPQAWANFPERGTDEPPDKYLARTAKASKGVADPFAWREVDRLQMLFGDGEYGDEWCIEYGEYATPYRTHGMARNDSETPTPESTLAGAPYPEAGERGGTSGPPARTVKLEYFDADTWMVVVNGKPAPGFENGGKDNPYKPFLPYMRTVALPAMYPLRFLVPALDAIETMQMNWAYLTAFPVVVIEAVEGVLKMLETVATGDTGEANPDLVWKPGKAWFPPPGYSMKFLDAPAAGHELHAMKMDLREMIDVVGVPSVFRGQGGSRQAGYSINQLIAASQMTYKKLVEGLERQQENVARFLFNCVGSTTGVSVYVLGNDGDAKKWLGLKPTGNVQQLVAPVDQLGPPKVKFRPVLPTDQEKMTVLATQAINAPRPLISHETALADFMQYDDPQGEVDNIWAERTLETETPNLVAAAYRELGLPIPGAPPEPNATPWQPNDVNSGGEATVPGITQALVPKNGQQPPGGGRPAGSFPGNQPVRP